MTPGLNVRQAFPAKEETGFVLPGPPAPPTVPEEFTEDVPAERKRIAQQLVEDYKFNTSRLQQLAASHVQNIVADQYSSTTDKQARIEALEMKVQDASNEMAKDLSAGISILADLNAQGRKEGREVAVGVGAAAVALRLGHPLLAVLSGVQMGGSFALTEATKRRMQSGRYEVPDYTGATGVARLLGRSFFNLSDAETAVDMIVSGRGSLNAARALRQLQEEEAKTGLGTEVLRSVIGLTTMVPGFRLSGKLVNNVIEAGQKALVKGKPEAYAIKVFRNYPAMAAVRASSSVGMFVYDNLRVGGRQDVGGSVTDALLFYTVGGMTQRLPGGGLIRGGIASGLTGAGVAGARLAGEKYILGHEISDQQIAREMTVSALGFFTHHMMLPSAWKTVAQGIELARIENRIEPNSHMDRTFRIARGAFQGLTGSPTADRRLVEAQWLERLGYNPNLIDTFPDPRVDTKAGKDFRAIDAWAESHRGEPRSKKWFKFLSRETGPLDTLEDSTLTGAIHMIETHLADDRPEIQPYRAGLESLKTEMLRALSAGEGEWAGKFAYSKRENRRALIRLAKETLNAFEQERTPGDEPVAQVTADGLVKAAMDVYDSDKDYREKLKKGASVPQALAQTLAVRAAEAVEKAAQAARAPKAPKAPAVPGAAAKAPKAPAVPGAPTPVPGEPVVRDQARMAKLGALPREQREELAVKFGLSAEDAKKLSPEALNIFVYDHAVALEQKRGQAPVVPPTEAQVVRDPAIMAEFAGWARDKRRLVARSYGASPAEMAKLSERELDEYIYDQSVAMKARVAGRAAKLEAKKAAPTGPTAPIEAKLSRREKEDLAVQLGVGWGWSREIAEMVSEKDLDRFIETRKGHLAESEESRTPKPSGPVPPAKVLPAPAALPTKAPEKTGQQLEADLAKMFAEKISLLPEALREEATWRVQGVAFYTLDGLQHRARALGVEGIAQLAKPDLRRAVAQAEITNFVREAEAKKGEEEQLVEVGGKPAEGPIVEKGPRAPSKPVSPPGEPGTRPKPKTRSEATQRPLPGTPEEEVGIEVGRAPVQRVEEVRGGLPKGAKVAAEVVPGKPPEAEPTGARAPVEPAKAPVAEVHAEAAPAAAAPGVAVLVDQPDPRGSDAPGQASISPNLLSTPGGYKVALRMAYPDLPKRQLDEVGARLEKGVWTTEDPRRFAEEASRVLVAPLGNPQEHSGSLFEDHKGKMVPLEGIDPHNVREALIRLWHIIRSRRREPLGVIVDGKLVPDLELNPLTGNPIQRGARQSVGEPQDPVVRLFVHGLRGGTLSSLIGPESGKPYEGPEKAYRAMLLDNPGNVPPVALGDLQKFALPRISKSLQEADLPALEAMVAEIGSRVGEPELALGHSRLAFKLLAMEPGEKPRVPKEGDEPVLRAIVALDQFYTKVFGTKDWYQKLVASDQLKGAAGLIKRLKAAFFRGEPLQGEGFGGDHPQQYQGGVNAIILEDPTYMGRKEAFDGRIAYSSRFLRDNLEHRGLIRPGQREIPGFIKEFLVLPGEDPLIGKGLSGIANAHEQQLMDKHGVDVIVYSSAAKAFGERQVHPFEMTPAGFRLEGEAVPFRIPLTSFVMDWAEKPGDMKRGIIRMPVQLTEAFDPLVGEKGSEAYQAVKTLFGGEVDLENAVWARVTENPIEFFRFIVRGEQYAQEEPEERESLESLRSDERMLRGLEGHPSAIIIASSPLFRAALEARLVNRIAESFLRPKVVGGLGILVPMNPSLEGIVGQKNLNRQDWIVLPGSARTIEIPLPKGVEWGQSTIPLGKLVELGHNPKVLGVRPPAPGARVVAALRVVGFSDDIGQTGMVVHPELGKRMLVSDNDGDKLHVLMGLPEAVTDHWYREINQFGEDGLPRALPLVPSELPPDHPKAAQKKVDEPLTVLSPYKLFERGYEIDLSKSNLQRAVSQSGRWNVLARTMWGAKNAPVESVIEVRDKDTGGTREVRFQVKLNAKNDKEFRALVDRLQEEWDEAIQNHADAVPTEDWNPRFTRLMVEALRVQVKGRWVKPSDKLAFKLFEGLAPVRQYRQVRDLLRRSPDGDHWNMQEVAAALEVAKEGAGHQGSLLFNFFARAEFDGTGLYPETHIAPDTWHKLLSKPSELLTLVLERAGAENQLAVHKRNEFFFSEDSLEERKQRGSTGTPQWHGEFLLVAGTKAEKALLAQEKLSQQTVQDNRLLARYLQTIARDIYLRGGPTDVAQAHKKRFGSFTVVKPLKENLDLLAATWVKDPVLQRLLDPEAAEPTEQDRSAARDAVLVAYQKLWKGSDKFRWNPNHQPRNVEAVSWNAVQTAAVIGQIARKAPSVAQELAKAADPSLTPAERRASLLGAVKALLASREGVDREHLALNLVIPGLQPEWTERRKGAAWLRELRYKPRVVPALLDFERQPELVEALERITNSADEVFDQVALPSSKPAPGWQEAMREVSGDKPRRAVTLGFLGGDALSQVYDRLGDLAEGPGRKARGLLRMVMADPTLKDSSKDFVPLMRLAEHGSASDLDLLRKALANRIAETLKLETLNPDDLTFEEMLPRDQRTQTSKLLEQIDDLQASIIRREAGQIAQDILHAQQARYRSWRFGTDFRERVFATNAGEARVLGSGTGPAKYWDSDDPWLHPLTHQTGNRMEQIHTEALAFLPGGQGILHETLKSGGKFTVPNPYHKAPLTYGEILLGRDEIERRMRVIAEQHYPSGGGTFLVKDAEGNEVRIGAVELWRDVNRLAGIRISPKDFLGVMTPRMRETWAGEATKEELLAELASELKDMPEYLREYYGFKEGEEPDPETFSRDQARKQFWAVWDREADDIYPWALQAAKAGSDAAKGDFAASVPMIAGSSKAIDIERSKLARTIAGKLITSSEARGLLPAYGRLLVLGKPTRRVIHATEQVREQKFTEGGNGEWVLDEDRTLGLARVTDRETHEQQMRMVNALLREVNNRAPLLVNFRPQAQRTRTASERLSGHLPIQYTSDIRERRRKDKEDRGVIQQRLDYLNRLLTEQREELEKEGLDEQTIQGVTYRLREELRWWEDYLKGEEKELQQPGGMRRFVEVGGPTQHRYIEEQERLWSQWARGLGPELSLSIVLRQWGSNLSQGLGRALYEARTLNMAEEFPHTSQRHAVQRMILNNMGNPLHSLEVNVPLPFGTGLGFDFGEEAMLGRVQAATQLYNRIRRMWGRKPIEAPTTYEVQRWLATADAQLGVFRFLYTMGVGLNNLAALKNPATFYGSMLAPTESPEYRNYVDELFRTGNAESHLASLEIEPESLSELLHPDIRNMLLEREARGKGKLSIRDKDALKILPALFMAASPHIFATPSGAAKRLIGAFAPYTPYLKDRPWLTTALREVRSNPKMLEAHRQLYTDLMGFVLQKSEVFARSQIWRNAAHDWIRLQKRVGGGWLERMNTEQGRLELIGHANAATNLAAYMFNNWGVADIHKTTTGKMLFRFRSWMPQDHELGNRLWDRDRPHLTGELLMFAKGAGQIPGWLAGNVTQLERMQAKWAVAQGLSRLAIKGPALLRALGVFGSMSLLEQGFMVQMSYGFSRNLAAPQIDLLFGVAEAALRWRDVYLAAQDGDEAQIGAALRAMDRSMRIFMNPNVANGILFWIAVVDFLDQGLTRDNQYILQSATGLPYPSVTGAAVAGGFNLTRKLLSGEE